MTPQQVQQWLGVASAAQPLIGAGILAAGQILALFKSAHPTATNEEMNAALGDVVTQAESELAAIEAERQVAKSDGQ